MIAELSKEWLHELDWTFFHEGRKVVMIVDNWAARPNIQEFDSDDPCLHTKIWQGFHSLRIMAFLSSLKAEYHIIIIHITTVLNNHKSLPIFKILESMYMITRTWDQLSTTTIIGPNYQLLKQGQDFWNVSKWSSSEIPWFRHHLVISKINLKSWDS